VAGFHAEVVAKVVQGDRVQPTLKKSLLLKNAFVVDKKETGEATFHLDDVSSGRRFI